MKKEKKKGASRTRLDKRLMKDEERYGRKKTRQEREIEIGMKNTKKQ